MVVNSSGRIDLFDISNSGRPVKITEIGAAASDAAFTPKGTARDKIQIISGGEDGTFRLWTLDGKPAAEPFKVVLGTRPNIVNFAASAVVTTCNW
jgi:WD40 repeat protein